MEVAQKDDRPTRKLFLLVSDGEDFGNELQRALVTRARGGYQVELHRHRHGAGRFHPGEKRRRAGDTPPGRHGTDR